VYHKGCRRLKITFLLTQSLESPSGLGRYWPLAKEIVRLGHQVTILALHHDFNALTQRRFIRDGVTVNYVGQMHVLKVGDSKSYFGSRRLVGIATAAAWELTRAALAVSTDIYHLGKPHPMNGAAIFLPHFLRRKQVYLDCDDFEAGTNRFTHGWQRLGVGLFEDYLPRLCAGITTNTHFMVGRLLDGGVPREKIFYVPNGVDRSRFSRIEASDVKDLRSRLQLADRQVVLYLGSLSLTNHPVDLLLEAFDIVKQAASHISLLLVGGGEDYERLRNRVNLGGMGDTVRFVGRVSSDEAPLYYALADVSVDPVRDDVAARSRCPLKIVESLAAGTPVITGDVGDRASLLSGGGGLLVPAGNAAALADSLLHTLADPATLNRLGVEALQAGKTHYWEVLVHDFMRVYNGTA
jgi:glycosyltransferase involved in cell wall biosynthesis